jgi:thioesterase domain-containing protein/acyl carrier protein
VFGAKSTLGKLSRPKLRKRYEAKEFSDYEKSQTELLLAYRQAQRVPPEGRYEQVVVETIAEVFAIPTMNLSCNDNFFELGGSSLELLRFKGIVSQRLGTKRDVPLTAIFNAPTVREIAKAFEEADKTEHKYEPIVTLQTPKSSNKSPLFFFHPGVGEVLVFIKLANYIKDRPVFALRASGFQPGEEMFTSVGQMVDVYYESIKEKQPQGPYYLAGYSYGGILAFEMAKKLEADGETVRFLATFDRSPHIKARMRSLRWIDDVVSISHLLGFTTNEQATRLKSELADKPKDEALKHLISLAPRDKLEVFDMDLDKFERWTSIGYGLHQLAREYEPSGSVRATMHAFYADPLPGVAANREEWAEAIALWKDFSATLPILYPCPGSHYTMIDGEHIQAFQAIFLKALALAD